MKKWLCVLLTLCMVLTLAACGEKTPRPETTRATPPLKMWKWN